MHHLKFAAFPKYATVLMNDQVMEFYRNKILATRSSFQSLPPFDILVTSVKMN